MANILFIGQSPLSEALRQTGFQVLTAHHTPGADIIHTSPATLKKLLADAATRGFYPDFLFYCDDGNLPLLIDPQSAQFPTVYYSIDTYCNPWHVPYAGAFDLALVAQKDFLDLFADYTSHWFPLFCGKVEAETDFSARDIPVSFVGTMGHKNNPQRKPFLDDFRRRHPIYITSGNYLPVFNRSRIVLNQTAFGEINYRCFEAIACGAALLMEECGNGFNELLEPGHDILPTYQRGNSAQAAAIAQKYLAMPRELERIARNGARTVGEKHTALARARTLASYLASLSQERRCGQQRSIYDKQTSARTAYAMLASEMEAPEWENYRKFYLALARE